MGDGLGDVGDGGFQAARYRDIRVGGNKFAARCDLLSNIQDQPAGRFALKSKGAVSGQNLFFAPPRSPGIRPDPDRLVWQQIQIHPLAEPR
jgi:hypothetical protein